MSTASKKPIPDYVFKQKACPGCKRTRSEKSFDGGNLCRICVLRKVQI